MSRDSLTKDDLAMLTRRDGGSARYVYTPTLHKPFGSGKAVREWAKKNSFRIEKFKGAVKFHADAATSD